MGSLSAQLTLPPLHACGVAFSPPLEFRIGTKALVKRLAKISSSSSLLFLCPLPDSIVNLSCTFAGKFAFT